MKKATIIICLTAILLTAAACSNLQQHITPHPQQAPESNVPTLAPIGQQPEAAATLTTNVSATVQARTRSEQANTPTPTPIGIAEEPSGGITETVVSEICDDVLRNQFVFQRNASTTESLNTLISVIQNQRAEQCHADVWNPSVINATQNTGCFAHDTVGTQDVPSGLHRTATDNQVRLTSGRDRDNNVIVHWDHEHRPTDGAKCWLYIARLKTWSGDYQETSTHYPTTADDKVSYTTIDLENPKDEPNPGEWYYMEMDDEGLAVEMFMMVTPSDEMLTMYGCSTVKERNFTEALVKIRYHQRLPMELITRETTLPINTFINGKQTPLEWVSSITQDTDIKLTGAHAQNLIKQIAENKATLYQLSFPNHLHLDRTIPVAGIPELIAQVGLECFKGKASEHEEQPFYPPEDPQEPQNGMYTYTTPDHGLEFQYPADCGQMWEAPGTADNSFGCTGERHEINTSVEMLNLKGAATELAESPEWFSKDFADNLAERFDNASRYKIATNSGQTLEVTRIQAEDIAGKVTLIMAAFTDQDWKLTSIYMAFMSDTSDMNDARVKQALQSFTSKNP